MARPDKVVFAYRGVVAGSNLTGVWGATIPDLICVDIDASGLLVAAGAGAAKGVIWTPEGKASPSVANFNVALAGSVMTVFVQAEFVGGTDWASPTLTAGDEIWSAAAGDVVDSTPGVGGQLIGFMAASDTGDVRLILNVDPEKNAGT